MQMLRTRQNLNFLVYSVWDPECCLSWDSGVCLHEDSRAASKTCIMHVCKSGTRSVLCKQLGIAFNKAAGAAGVHNAGCCECLLLCRPEQLPVEEAGRRSPSPFCSPYGQTAFNWNRKSHNLEEKKKFPEALFWIVILFSQVSSPLKDVWAAGSSVNFVHSHIMERVEKGVTHWDCFSLNKLNSASWWLVEKKEFYFSDWNP